MSIKLLGNKNSPKRGIFLRRLTSIVRYDLFGKEAEKGYIFRLLMYIILIDTAFIYMRPILYMLTTMVKDAGSMMDPSIIWVPRTLYWGNLQEAFRLLNYPVSFSISVTVSLLISGLQVISCAIAGYAFARLEFPFKRFWFICLIFTFILPPQVIILPTILLFKQFNWLDTYLPMIVPAILGHGLRGSLFIIIYRQFFSTLPKELEEAARLEGASVFKIFFRVMLPISMPAIIVVFLFSFVWNWNDAYFPTMYLFQAQDVPLSISSTRLAAKMALEADQAGPSILADPIRMAASFLIIAPVLTIFAYAQRWFMEGVGRTGMVE